MMRDLKSRPVKWRGNSRNMTVTNTEICTSIKEARAEVTDRLAVAGLVPHAGWEADGDTVLSSRQHILLKLHSFQRMDVLKRHKDNGETKWQTAFISEMLSCIQEPQSDINTLYITFKLQKWVKHRLWVHVPSFFPLRCTGAWVCNPDGCKPLWGARQDTEGPHTGIHRRAPQRAAAGPGELEDTSDRRNSSVT